LLNHELLPKLLEKNFYPLSYSVVSCAITPTEKLSYLWQIIQAEGVIVRNQISCDDDKEIIGDKLRKKCRCQGNGEWRMENGE